MTFQVTLGEYMSFWISISKLIKWYSYTWSPNAIALFNKELNFCIWWFDMWGHGATVVFSSPKNPEFTAFIHTLGQYSPALITSMQTPDNYHSIVPKVLWNYSKHSYICLWFHLFLQKKPQTELLYHSLSTPLPLCLLTDPDISIPRPKCWFNQNHE
jgi:hypothetical protein